MSDIRPTSRLCLLGALALACGIAPADHPNVVLVVIDTLRADKLGAYGLPLASSPELDALAASGVRFEHVVAQSPWTRPSIGSLLTSVHPRNLGLHSERDHALGEGFETLAEILSRAGYATLGATANPNLNRVFHFDQGFDHYADSEVLFDWMQPRTRESGERRPPLLPARTLYERLLAQARDPEGGPPFYLQVVVMDVHEYLDDRASHPDDTAGFDTDPVPAYLSAVRRVSRWTAAFVQALRVLPGFEDTLFVVTSDHGEGLQDHPSVDYSSSHGFLLYESHMRVPLLLFDTEGRLPAGRSVARPVRLLDVAPTVLDYVGLPAPAAMEGVSLLPLLDGGEVALPELFVSETRFRGHHKLAVHSAAWTYVESRDGHAGTDPVELQKTGDASDGRATNRAVGHPGVVRRLARFLADWRERNPGAPPSPLRRELSPDETEQLRGLGYLE